MAVDGQLPVRKFGLVIFDLDGTLIDSQYDLALAVNHIRAAYGLPGISVDTVRAYIGNGIKSLVEKMITVEAGRGIENTISEFRAFYGEHLLDNTRLYPGVLEVLESLSAVKKAVLTNKPEAFTKEIIKGLRIDKYFESVSGGDSGRKKKPDPEPILEILTRFGISKNGCIMVGDGKNDILAARAAGIKCVAAQYGYTGKTELNAFGPDYTIKSIAELPKILLD